jgi:hypothetical protein
MNDVTPRDTMFDNIAEAPLQRITEQRRAYRSERRLAAIAAIQMARDHGGRSKQPFIALDADALIAVMELLDRVANT